jgi:hypothetical protein
MCSKTYSQNMELVQQIYIFIYMVYNQNMVKYFVDDFEEHQKFEKKKD